MKTPAAILVEQQQPLVIDEVEIPPLAYGQVLVDIKVSRICGSQIGEIDGVKGPDRYLPHLLGHEGGGIVLETGPEVTQVKPGDRVVLHWRSGAGINAPCPKYSWNGQTVNSGNITTFSHQAIISENRITRVDNAIDFETCALLADTLTTGFGAINNDAQAKLGESILIIGCGGIGLGTLLGAKLAGLYPIIAADIQDHKLEKAKAIGATHTINSMHEDLTTAVRSIVGDAGVDISVDGTGNPQVIEQAFNLTQKQGRCILVGVMHHSRQLNLNTLPLHFEKNIIGTSGGKSLPAQDIPRYTRMIQAGAWDVQDFVSHRGSLNDVNDLIAKMRSGEVIHAMLHFN